MSSRSFSMAFAALGVPLVLTVSAFAQEEDFGALMGRALAAMNEGKWEEALDLNTGAVTRFGADKPLQKFGPQFGAVYFHKGTCEMKLQRWDDAMQSFEICNRDFPNTPQTGETGNSFQKTALLKWGEAAMGAKNWELAISRFQKFLNERDKQRDKFAQGAFHIGMAVCFYQTGRIPAGNENLEIAINNKAGFSTPETGIIAGFQALVAAAIGTRNERALLDFIGKNRGGLVAEPFIMQRFSRVFLKLAADATAADMDRAALELYQLVPSTEAAMDDIRARIKNPAGLDDTETKQLAEDLTALEAEWRDGNTTDNIRLAAIAALHGKHGNLRGAHAAYRQLEWYYSGSNTHEDNLFQLIRTSCLVGAVEDIRQYGALFEKTFPTSARLAEMRRMLWLALFQHGEYAACIELTAPAAGKLQPDSPEQDVCLYVLGASYFHTGQYDKAGPLLEQHVARYPKSLFALPAAYFRAANLVRLQSWKQAAEMMDAFIAAYPEAAQNAFLPFALLDRAVCHQAMGEGDAALEDIARLTKEFPDCEVIEQAYNLQGGIQQALGKLDEAGQSHAKALEIAASRRNRAAAGEALYHLIDLTKSARAKGTLAHAEMFWKEYADGSPYRAKVAVAGIPAFMAAGRGDEALARLRDVIGETAVTPEAPGLPELINTYATAYLEKHSPEELREHDRKFPGIRADDQRARSLLRVAVIGAFEEAAAKSGDEKRKAALTATIKVLFQELKTEFAAKDLAGFILVKLADHLRLNTSTPREALPYYDEVLARPETSCHNAALLGRADVHAASGNPADLEKALADFNRVAAESADPAERDYAAGRAKGLQNKPLTK